MRNDPMQWQLTVGQLRRALQSASDDAVVGLKVPKGGIGHADLETYINLAIHRSSDPMVVLVPTTGPGAQTTGLRPNTSLERTREK